MNLERFKRIIQGYIDEKLSATEKKRVDSWFDSITNADISPFKNDHHKRKIKSDILSGIPDHIYRRTQPSWLQRRTFLLPIAASIVLFCTIGVLFLNKSHLSFLRPAGNSIVFDQISTSAGERKAYILPDSSSIWLNGNAQLRVHPASYAKNRTVYLDQGEAFFDVQQDSLHPFVIETESLSIQVVGTSFNVHNSKLLNQVTIDVKTGKVKVNHMQGKEQHILTKGNSLHYNVDNSAFRLFDSEPLTAGVWTTGGVFLNDATFGELQELMYNRYGLSLYSEGPLTETFRYSILMPHALSVEELLNMICNIHQINYRREDDEIILYE